ncbi:hypothetical protein SAMN02927937_02065 [Paenimyroides aquimaris]|uniref:Uncharacterized protein n=1 Tax=Paenimyroides marinum TaxID=1159016 RepID=A0A1H6LQ57_9FLAO|nr:hypothetical protein SAMN02927937_02065 [Paenimyroides aquimaris]
MLFYNIILHKNNPHFFGKFVLLIQEYVNKRKIIEFYRANY